MGDFSISGIINGDASGFEGAINDASSSLSNFAALAGSVLAGIGGAELFGGIASGISGLASQIVTTASNFQSYGETFTNVLANLSAGAGAAGDSLTSMSAGAAASALEATDALIKYNEKITEINDNIATVMQGQNVIDAQTQMYDQLGQLAQTYSDKIQSINDQIDQANADLIDREEQRQQSMNNSLQDMQLSHQDQVASTTEQYTQKMSETNSAVEKAKLQEELDNKLKLMNDDYARQYDTKQTELQRNLDQQKAADQEANTDKIQKFQAEISKENTLYADQVEKVKDASNKKIATLEVENTKKLAMYQQELADEERSYQLSLAKRAASAAGGGGAGSRSEWSLGLLQPMELGQQYFANINESASMLESHLMNISQSQPFQLMDIDSASQGMLALGLNVEKTEPMIADLAGYWHTGLSTATQAVQDEIAGNGRMMEMQFHLSKQEIEAAFDQTAGPGKMIKNVNDLIVAMHNLDDQNLHLKGSFAGGSEAMMQTPPGAMSNVKDHADKVMLSIMGISTAEQTFGQIDPHGLFAELQGAINDLLNYMNTHAPQIRDIAQTIGKDIASAIQKLGDFISSHKEDIKTFFSDLGGAINFAVTHKDELLLLLAGIEAFKISKGAADGLNSIFTTLHNIGGTVTTASTDFDKLKGSASTASGIIHESFSNLPNIMTGVKSGITATKDAMTGFKNAVSDAQIPTKIFSGLQAALNVIMDANPIVLVVLAVLALAAGFIWAYNNVKPFRDFINGLWDDLKKAASWLAGEFKKIWNDFTVQFPNFVNNAGKTFATFWDNLWTGIKTAWNNITKAVSDGIQGIFNFFESKLADFENWGENLIKSFISGITKGLSNIGSTIGNALGGVAKNLQGHSPPDEGPLKDIDKWGFNVGNAWVGGFQQAVAGLQVNAPALAGMGSEAGGGATGNYNSSSVVNNSPVTMNNAFTITGAANAQNTTDYLAWLLQHKGVV